MSRRVVLVACVSQKAPTPGLAQDLYTSPWFRKARAYAESLGGAWFVLSAKYGLVLPRQEIEPYEFTLNTASAEARRAWASGVLEQLRPFVESGDEVVMLAGARYRENLEPVLSAWGISVTVPMEGLTIGRQLQWLSNEVGGDSGDSADGSGLALEVSRAFSGGTLDLSGRAGAPTPGWSSLPECEAAATLKNSGASDSHVRLFLSLIAPLDRARDADRLWAAGTKLWLARRWAFDPDEIRRHSHLELLDALRSEGVSQRHTVDAAAWRTIAEVLSDAAHEPTVYRAVFDGQGDARELLQALRATTAEGTKLFPYLSGPKVGPMWIRMLAEPGGASIASLDCLNVAVDVQVKKVSQYLGVTATASQTVDQARAIIEAAWREQVEAHGADGPVALRDTAAALDPALWFFGKWGCTICERSHEKRPVAVVCGNCTYEA